MPKAYVPLEKVPAKYSIPVIPEESIIEKDKEFYLNASRWSYGDGALHNNVIYTVPAGQVLFIEQVSVTASTNDTDGYVHVTCNPSGGTLVGSGYIGGVELRGGGRLSTVNHFPTPIKLIEGEQINGLAYQPNAAGVLLNTIIIITGYTKANF